MRYYVNKNPQSNGDHEVHTSECSWLPEQNNRIYLGNFTNCREAVKEAQKHYKKSNGCYHCSISCHTS